MFPPQPLYHLVQSNISKKLIHNICVSITDCDLTSEFRQRCNLKTCILSDGQRVEKSEREIWLNVSLWKRTLLLTWFSTSANSQQSVPDDFMISVACLKFRFVRKSWSLSLIPNSTNTDTSAWRRSRPRVPQRQYLRHKIPVDQWINTLQKNMDERPKGP